MLQEASRTAIFLHSKLLMEKYMQLYIIANEISYCATAMGQNTISFIIYMPFFELDIKSCHIKF